MSDEQARSGENQGNGWAQSAPEEANRALEGRAQQLALELQEARADLKQVEFLFHASRQVALAQSPEEVFEVLQTALYRAVYPFVLLVAVGNTLHVAGLRSAESGKPALNEQGSGIQILGTRQDFEVQFTQEKPWIVCEFDQHTDYPICLMEIPQQLKWSTAAYFPVKRQEKIEAIFIFGTSGSEKLNQARLQSFADLAELVSTALTKLSAQRIMERRLDALQMLNTISQAVSVQTNIDELYRIIHQEVTRIMGEVEFLIATYDPVLNSIQIPYMYESGAFLKYDPFPLGEGLTSILINTRQSLMLVENTEVEAKALGAKVLGKPAKSWLGVPLITAGEVIGAMIVQDLEHEFRFDEDDQRMLSTLASQVAVTIRNARLLESTQRQAERERLLYQVTGKIRSASDIQTILDTTATELRKALKARRAEIKIGMDKE